MATVIRFRPYRLPDLIDSAFVAQNPKINEEWCLEDLAKSGLVPEDLGAAYHPKIRLPDGALAGYHIPYFNIDGDVIVDANTTNVMYRRRYKLPDYSRNSRYLQPSTETLAKYELPAYLPYLLPFDKEWPTETMYCVEGEKKTAAFIKYLQLPAFGISGCAMWGDPRKVNRIHPWIQDYLTTHAVKKVIIIPDSDVYRYDMAAMYGNFVKALESLEYGVKLLNPPAKIDDFIIANRNNLLEAFAAIPEINGDDLVQTPASLLSKHALAFKTDAKGNRIVHQHTSNIMKLMEEHNAFPKIWRNTDNNRVVVGDKLAEPDSTEMFIANYFQHNLGFDKVTHKTIYPCIQALAKKNARSPMLDFIRDQSWDGNKRLGSWFTDYWGVQDSPYTSEIGIKWLVSACARMAQPGVRLRWMPIVIGPQRTGKTSLPDLLFRGCAVTLYGDHNDKDLHMLMHSSLCVGFDELDSFGKKEAGTLKAMISNKEDSFRPPYGSSIEVFPRRFTMYGCGNRHEFIQHDPSGYDRYAVIEVTQILDFKRLETDLAQLWAEAWHVYQQGGIKYWEIDGNTENAEKYVVANVLEEKICNWLEKEKMVKHTARQESVLEFTMTNLLVAIQEESSNKNTNVTREIAAILKGMGIEQVRIRKGPKILRLYQYRW
jgi:hypothetical protein